MTIVWAGKGSDEKKSRHNSVVEASLYTNECFVPENATNFAHRGEGTTKSKTNNTNVYED